jgi:GNAT superfamily N-acetyltransferase
VVELKTQNGRIRALTHGDIPEAVKLSSAAGWNQTADDWRLLLELAADGCVCVEADGGVVATTTFMCYGRQLGWIGMVLTHSEYRGRGFATHLLTHVLTRAEALGVRTVKLDATEQGQRLYSKLGFVAEQPVERWFRAAVPVATQQTSATRGEISPWFKADAAAFGTDRSTLLRQLAQRGPCSTNARAYVLTRSGRNTAYIGPCVAQDSRATRELLHSVVRTPAAGGWAWDLLPQNRDVASLAIELGFTPQRRLVRMSRGEKLQGEAKMVHAIAGFEFG